MLRQPGVEVSGEGEEVFPVEPVVFHCYACTVLSDDGTAEGEHAILRKWEQDGQTLSDRCAEAEDAQAGQREVLGDRHPNQSGRADLHREVRLDARMLAFTEVGVEKLGHVRSVNRAVRWGNFLSTVGDTAGSTLSCQEGRAPAPDEESTGVERGGPSLRSTRPLPRPVRLTLPRCTAGTVRE